MAPDAHKGTRGRAATPKETRNRGREHASPTEENPSEELAKLLGSLTLSRRDRAAAEELLLRETSRRGSSSE